MAVILAGALLLILGVGIQTAYADESGYTVDVSLVDNTVSEILPGVPYNLKAEINYNGKTVTLPADAVCNWSAGLRGPEIPVEEQADFLKNNVHLTKSPDDPCMASILVDKLPENVPMIELFVNFEVVIDGVSYISEEGATMLVMRDGFYEPVTPQIDPNIMVQEPVEVTAKVLYHKVSEWEDTVEPVEADCSWEYDDSIVKVEEKGRQSDGSYSFIITRLRADVDYDGLTLKMKVDGVDNTFGESYPLYSYSHDLSNSSIGVTPNQYFSIFADNWCIVDEVAANKAGAPTSIAMSDMYVHAQKDTITQSLSDKLFDVRVEKYIGNDGVSDEDVFDLSSFPLKFDPKGTKDKNGNRTDGTALYYITLTGKAGSGWTGTTDMYLFVCSKYSLYNFQDYFLGTVEFPALAKYLKDWDKDPYMRYEVPKGNKAKKTLVVKLGNDKLTPGKQITVKYRNDKTKKEYSSFPTNKPGEYTLVITGKSPYYGKDTSTHLKIGMKNPLVVKGKTVKIKKKQIKKKAKTLKAKRVVKIKKKGKGKLTYKKLSGNKKITVASNGKVKVKKGLKKGTYKVKVSVTAAGNDQYFPITKKVTFKIKVKK